MNPLLSGRAWLPAAVASVSLMVVLVLLQVLGTTDPGFFGPRGFDPGSVRVLLGTVVALALLLGGGLLGCRWVLRGTAGSAALPVFLSVWMALVVSTALASFGSILVGRAGAGSVSGVATSAFANAGNFGVRWGWSSALLAVLVHLFLGRTPAAAVDPDDVTESPRPKRGEPGVVPEGGFVLKRQSDFPEVRLGRDPADEVAPDPVQEEPARYVGKRAAARIAEERPADVEEPSDPASGSHRLPVA
ncbi:MAG: hypothetical protein ABI873_04480 [Marmoricola sp.]